MNQKTLLWDKGTHTSDKVVIGGKQQTDNTYLITTLGDFLKHSLTK